MIMRGEAKRSNNNYRKKPDVFHDTFMARRSPAEIIQCSGCGAFYYQRRGTLTTPHNKFVRVVWERH